MAHMLATHNGKVSMVYAGSVPWHKLGEPITDTKNVLDAMSQANMDLDLVEIPLFYDRDGRRYPSGSKSIISATNPSRCYGVVEASWKLIQPRESFAWLQSVVDCGAATVEAAGTLLNREGKSARQWVCLKLTDATHEIVPGDDIQCYVFAAVGHDGSLSWYAGQTATRLVCNNTLQIALQNKSEARFRVLHRANASQNLDKVQAALRDASKNAANAVGVFRALATKSVKDEQVKAFIKAIFKPTKKDVDSESQEVSTDISFDDLLQRPVVLSGETAFHKAHPADAEKMAQEVTSRIQDEVFQIFQAGGGNTAWHALNAATQKLTHGGQTQESSFRNTILQPSSRAMAVNKTALDMFLQP
jgi:phage/plasmid-like protein (TIGR03299 family)